jgi:hypothetical protein
MITLENLRNKENLRNYQITVGTFTNCRECGLTFVIQGFHDEKNEYHNIDSFTWCVYEHRNSDEIIINGKEGYICRNGELPYNGDSKYSFLESFSYNEHELCADSLVNRIQAYTTGILNRMNDER